jgi:hydrogenase maturation protease
MTGRARVLACGSPDGGDDAAGLSVLRLLPEALCARASIEEVRQLSAEQLLDDEPDTVRLVIDCVAGLEPGRVVELPLAELPALEARLQPGSSHALGVGQAVALADRLGGVRPADRFLGIGGARFDLGAGLSPAVAAGLPELAALLAARIEEIG